MNAFYTLLLLFFVIIYIAAAVEFNTIANLKGYPGTKYGWWSFWFPFAGWMMVIALPDRNQQDQTASAPIYDDALPEL